MQIFKVQSMTCGHCVRAITQAVQTRDPSASVEVRLAEGEVRVESGLSTKELIDAISAEGYDVQQA